MFYMIAMNLTANIARLKDKAPPLEYVVAIKLFVETISTRIYVWLLRHFLVEKIRSPRKEHHPLQG